MILSTFQEQVQACAFLYPFHILEVTCIPRSHLIDATNMAAKKEVGEGTALQQKPHFRRTKNNRFTAGAMLLSRDSIMSRGLRRYGNQVLITDLWSSNRRQMVLLVTTKLAL